MLLFKNIKGDKLDPVQHTIEVLKNEFPSEATTEQWQMLINSIPQDWHDIIEQGNQIYKVGEWVAISDNYNKITRTFRIAPGDNTLLVEFAVTELKTKSFSRVN